MSFFGPNAVVDGEKARVYDYQEDRAELESSGSVSAPGVDTQGAVPRMPMGVPLQPLADMWKNANAPTTPQELEQKLRAQQLPPPHMWMGPPPPHPGSGAPPMMPPPHGAPFPPMGPFPGGGFMPPPPPMGHQGPVAPVPPPGAFPGMPPPPPSIWGNAGDGTNSAPNAGAPQFPGFPNQSPWGYPPSQLPPHNQQFQQFAQQQAQPQQPQQPYQQPQPQQFPPQAYQNIPQPPHTPQTAPTPQVPTPQVLTPQAVATPPVAAAPQNVPPQPVSQPAVPPPQAVSAPQPVHPVPNAPNTGESQPSSRKATPAAEENKPEGKSQDARKFSDSANPKPYSLTPKTRVAAKSIAEAQNEQQIQYSWSQKNDAAPSSINGFNPRNNARRTEEYFAESEALRPNRRYRHLMTDHDKRHVMDKCVKTMANDDPFVDDYYFHVYTRTHGREADSRQAAKYRRVFHKGSGSTSDKLRQQVQRAVERAQEYRQRMKEEDRPLRKITASASRPRQALPLFDGKNSSGSSSTGSESHTGGAGVLSNALSDNSGAPTSEVSAESTLKSIEAAYDCILALEEHAQRRPASTDPAAVEWAQEGPPLQEKLWLSFQVQKPLDKNNKQPFVEMLRVPKGMKAFGRSWAQFDPTKRLTVLTRLVVNIADVLIKPRDFELFGQAVIQPLVHLVGEADMRTVLLMADLAITKASELAESRIGQLVLTAIVSRAEMLSQEGSSPEAKENASQWQAAFGPLFDAIVPVIPKLDAQDDSIWHFFAALALCSEINRQSELVDLVRSQIFAQHNAAKQLGGEAGEQKLVALNLFLNVLGLNATFEDIKELQA